MNNYRLLEKNGLNYLQFERYNELGIQHGFFGRQGGVSPKPWDSLNLGGTVGDPRENIIENRRRIFEVMDRPVESIFDCWQVHSTDVIVTDRPRPLDEPHREADIILTNHPEVTLFMRFADCVPIMLYDPTKKAVGLIHAGWRGTVHQACRVAVEAMCKAYQTNPGDIAAVIGPSVGPDHYEVGLDVVHEVEAWLPDIKSEILFKIDGKYILDLWKTNTLVLQKARVKTIDVAEICTACHTDDWFSHRGDHGKTGRYGALIAL